jgi:hypothetical protein
MSNTLPVRLVSRKTADGEIFEGTVTISANLVPTKLRRRADNSTQFPTRSAVLGTARNVAKALGFSDVEVSDNTTAAKTTKVAAKATATKKAAKKSSVASKATARPATPPSTQASNGTTISRPTASR